MQQLEKLVHQRWWRRITTLEKFAEKLGVIPEIVRTLTQSPEWGEEAEKIIRVQEKYPTAFQRWCNSVKCPVANIEQRLFLTRDKICEILTDMNVEYKKP